MNVYENESSIELSGDIDLASSGTLSLLEKKLHGRENIVFDVRGLQHVDTTFLRFLVRLREHAVNEEFTAVELIGVKPNLRRILEITGLARMFALQRATTDITKASFRRFASGPEAQRNIDPQ